MEEFQLERQPQPETESEIIARLTAENETLREKLKVSEANAATDELTGLPKRKFAELAVEKELGAARRGDSTAVVIIFDLDNFKKINDNAGHSQGDVVLVGFSNIMKEEMRDEDVLSRWGGEEFLAILRLPAGATEEQVREILERYQQKVKTINRWKEKKDFEPLTFSAGCVIVDSDSVSTPKDIFDLADKKLYESKEGGRDRSTIARPSAPASIPQTISTEA